MSGKNTDFDGNGPNRRTILKALGGGSFTAATLGVAPATATSDGTTEIVTIRGENNKPIKKKEVPQAWYDHLQKARHTRDQLAKKFGDRSWYQGAGFEPTDQWYDGKRGFSMSIEATNPSKARREAPDAQNGIDIAIEQYPEPQPMSDHCRPDDCPSTAQETTTYSCVPGGAWLTSYTGSCQVQYDGSPMYLTVAHGPADNYELYECSDDDLTGDVVYQGDSETPLGEIYAYDYDLDMAVIDPYDDNLSDKLIPEDYTVFGHVSEDGVADYKSSGETIYFFGAKRGERTSGTIRKQFQWTPCWENDSSVDQPYIRFNDINPCYGDSGGPYYVIDDILGIGNILAIISIHHSGCADWNTSRGPAAFEMVNDHPMDFSQKTDLC